VIVSRVALPLTTPGISKRWRGVRQAAPGAPDRNPVVSVPTLALHRAAAPSARKTAKSASPESLQHLGVPNHAYSSNAKRRASGDENFTRLPLPLQYEHLPLPFQSSVLSFFGVRVSEVEVFWLPAA
jgi:hypothetical protein